MIGVGMEIVPMLTPRIQHKGWGWVEARIELDSHALRQFSRCDSGLRALNVEEREALDDMKRREAELYSESRVMNEADRWTAVDAERIDLEEQDIAARRSAIQAARQTWGDADKAVAGAIVTVSREGDAEIVRGLVRAVDKRGHDAGTRLAEPERAGAVPAVPTQGSAEQSGRGYREAMVRRLTAHRTAALQAALTASVPTALVALTYALARQVFENDRSGPACATQVLARPSAQELLRAADDLPASRAWTELAAARSACLERLPASASAWLPWLAELPQADLLGLLAFCAAACINGHTGARDGSTSVLERMVGLDMAQWWQPTAEGILTHVSKAQMVQALKEAGPGLGDDGAGAMNLRTAVDAG